MKLLIQLYITSISFLPVDQKSDSTSQAVSKSTEQSTDKLAGDKESTGDGVSRFVYNTSTIDPTKKLHQCCLIETGEMSS